MKEALDFIASAPLAQDDRLPIEHAARPFETMIRRSLQETAAGQSAVLQG